jgi:hypothetical protein
MRWDLRLLGGKGYRVTILDQLSAFANSTLPLGINWPEQLQQYGSKEASVRAYRDEPAGKGGYWSDLITVRGACVIPFGQLGFDVRMDLPTLQASRAQNQSEIEARTAELAQALAAKQSQLSIPVKFDVEALRDFLETYLAQLSTATEMHTSKLIFEFGMTETQIADNADSIARAYNQLRYLYESGVLHRLKRSPVVGVEYLGQVLLGIGVLLLVAILAAAILYSQYLCSSIEAARAGCLALIKAGHPGAATMCAKLVPQPPIEPFNPNQAVNSGLATIGVVAAVGLGAWILVNMRRKA